MKYRKLRIAWSVVWGILCLLLIVLWVRSYSSYDFVKVMPTAGLVSGVGVVMADTVDHHWFHNSLLETESVRHNDIDERRSGFWGFGYNIWQDGDWQVWAPHWFVVIITVCVGAAPWWSLRFSLRTLIIAMTVVAVALGLIVFSMQ
jgi:hypothetical protein